MSDPLRRRFASTVLFGLVLLAGLGAARADTVAVDIREYKFTPQTLTIQAGTTVRWTNNEKRTSHSVVFPAEDVRSERLFPEESWERTFARPGRYAYTCDPHAEMKGLVVVTE